MRMLTIEQVMKELGVGRRSVRQFIESGELRAVNVSASRSSQRPRLRVHEADLQAFMDGRSVGGSSQQSSKARRYKPRKNYI